MYKRPFLPVQASFWPILVRFSIFSVMASFLLFSHRFITLFQVTISGIVLVLTVLLWWKDLSRESMIGYHTHKLESSLRVGMLLFILSEVFFFVRFFWAFYDAALTPTTELGLTWPPIGITPLSVYSVPLLNTVILLTSGITVTWCHHALINNYYLKSVYSLAMTVTLGIYFLSMQYVEYLEASFTMADGVYGSTFFLATGFHGMHVLIGTLFLIYSFYNLITAKLVYNHHFSFEAAAWYWHFVDVVWLILFISIYWWGSL